MGCKVLTIEEDEVMRRFICQSLAEEGHHVIGAGDAGRGLAMACDEAPDIVICGAGADGAGARKIFLDLRQNQGTAGIPCIMITEPDAGMDPDFERQPGPDAWITKPFNASDLAAAVRSQQAKTEIRRKHADQRLTELRTNISMALPHELLTPLNGIMGFAELIKDIGPNLSGPELTEMAQNILGSANRLHRLVQNYLVYAQIEILSTDQRQIESLREARADHVAVALRTYAEGLAKNLGRGEDLRLHVMDGLAAVSQEHLLKIFGEVLQNAFRFSETGQPVHVSASFSSVALTLQIKDHGRGLSPQDLENLGAYAQFGRNRHEQQGIGLGLVIAKRLSELYGGCLTVQNNLDCPGLTVTVSLPAEGPVAEESFGAAAAHDHREG